jgi:glutathione S-transferase
MTTTLYHSPGSCSLAAHIVLEEIGKPFSLAFVSSSDGSTSSPEHLRLNPKGRIPVLTVDEAIYTELPAILFQLALSSPTSGLVPEAPEELVRCMEWFNWLSGTVHAVAIRLVWRPENFTRDPQQHNGVIAIGKGNLADAFQFIETRMTHTDWAVGNRYSIVDPFLIVIFRWGNRIGFDMRERYPSWTRHTMRILERPAVVRALATEKVSVWK